MKYIFTTLLFFVLLFPAFSQQDGVIDDPGDIAFVAYHDNDDGFSFVFTDDCPAGTVIVFIDSEWTGTAFNLGEGDVTWTNNTGSVIAQGTVIHITDADDNTAGIAASTGTAAETDSGFTCGTSNDQIIAIIGTRAAPTAFLAFVGDTGDPNFPSFVNTGLVLGTHAVDLGDNEGYYSGPTDCNSNLTDCLQMINDVTNWNTGGFIFPGVVPNSFTGTVLPVELTYFKGQVKSQQIQITWETAAELDNDYMIIERSRDGRIFEAIGQVDGTGTSYQTQNYSLMDKKPMSGLNYYRLRQVDFDGKEQVFSTIVVSFQSGENNIHFFPTQVVNTITIQLDEKRNTDTQVDIFYLSGQKVMHQVLLAGDVMIAIDVNHLVKGSYFARLTIGNEVITKRFVKM